MGSAFPQSTVDRQAPASPCTAKCHASYRTVRASWNVVPCVLDLAVSTRPQTDTANHALSFGPRQIAAVVPLAAAVILPLCLLRGLAALKIPSLIGIGGNPPNLNHTQSRSRPCFAARHFLMDSAQHLRCDVRLAAVPSASAVRCAVLKRGVRCKPRLRVRDRGLVEVRMHHEDPCAEQSRRGSQVGEKPDSASTSASSAVYRGRSN